MNVSDCILMPVEMKPAQAFAVGLVSWCGSPGSAVVSGAEPVPGLWVGRGAGGVG